MKQYSEKEMKRIIENNVEVPDIVNKKMEEAYHMLDIKKNKPAIIRRRRRRWIAAAAVAAAATMSVGVMAATGFFSKVLKQSNTSVEYELTFDYELTPYDIEVSAGYLPEGFAEAPKNSPYEGKIRNEEIDCTITLIPYNAADLDRLENGGGLTRNGITDIQKETLHDMEAHILTRDDGYRNVFLFNETDGYVVEVYFGGDESKISDAELKKVVNNLQIKQLDTQTAYMTEEERTEANEEKEQRENEAKTFYNAGVPKERVAEIGEQIMDMDLMEEVENGCAALEEMGDVRFTVLEAELRDSLPAAEFGVEHYFKYEEDVKPQLNEDGTLKLHDRKDLITRKVETDIR